MSAEAVPYPPYELATRVGSLDGAEDPWGFFDWHGSTARAEILEALPEGYDLAGRRVLDFGCGAGRTLRHFVIDGPDAEYWGTDIDEESISWLRANLSPPLTVLVNDEAPPLAVADASFDVVYCISVFTHLDATWSRWLLELHRVLKPGGLLVTTFMGEGQSQEIAGEDWDDRRVGMLVLRPGAPWDEGGPMVMHSPWWIREHWGRAFDVLSVKPSGFTSNDPSLGHGLVTLRRRDVVLRADDLEAPSDDPREVTALAHNVSRLADEARDLRRSLSAVSAERDRAVVERDVLSTSRSWKLTRPLRQAAQALRGR